MALGQTAKFNVQAALVFNKVQSVEGTPVVPAAADIVPLTDFSYEEVFNTEELQYIGSDSTRDAENIIKDRYSKYSGNAFMPVRGNVTLVAVTNFPMYGLFQACGATCTLTGASNTDQIVTVTNATVPTTLLTGQVRFSTSDVATQKDFQVFDTKGTVDLSLEILNRTKLKFNMMGNYTRATMDVALTPAYGTQKSLAAPVVAKANVVCCELTGPNVAHTGISGTIKNVNISKLDAPNLFGFSLDRFAVSGIQGFTRDPDPSDVTITILEDVALPTESVTTNYDPDNNIGNYHKFSFKWGVSQGVYVTIYFDNLQLVSTSQSTISKFRARDLKFRNIGNTTLTFPF